MHSSNGRHLPSGIETPGLKPRNRVAIRPSQSAESFNIWVDKLKCVARRSLKFSKNWTIVPVITRNFRIHLCKVVR
jgi:hypothetical protein